MSGLTPTAQHVSPQNPIPLSERHRALQSRKIGPYAFYGLVGKGKKMIRRSSCRTHLGDKVTFFL